MALYLILIFVFSIDICLGPSHSLPISKSKSTHLSLETPHTFVKANSFVNTVIKESSETAFEDIPTTLQPTEESLKNIPTESQPTKESMKDEKHLKSQLKKILKEKKSIKSQIKNLSKTKKMLRDQMKKLSEKKKSLEDKGITERSVKGSNEDEETTLGSYEIEETTIDDSIEAESSSEYSNQGEQTLEGSYEYEAFTEFSNENEETTAVSYKAHFTKPLKIHFSPSEEECKSILDDITRADSLIGLIRKKFALGSKIIQAKKRFYGLCWKGRKKGWDYTPGDIPTLAKLIKDVENENFPEVISDID